MTFGSIYAEANRVVVGELTEARVKKALDGETDGKS